MISSVDPCHRSVISILQAHAHTHSASQPLWHIYKISARVFNVHHTYKWAEIATDKRFEQLAELALKRPSMNF